MPRPNQVDQPMWQRFAQWYMKWKGKSNHVHVLKREKHHFRFIRRPKLINKEDTAQESIIEPKLYLVTFE